MEPGVQLCPENWAGIGGPIAAPLRLLCVLWGGGAVETISIIHKS